MSPANGENLAARLIALREAHDPPLSQGDAAKLVGMTPRRYADIERGHSHPRPGTLNRIATAFGLPPHVLLGRNPDSLDDPQLTRIEQKLDAIINHLGVPARIPTPSEVADAFEAEDQPAAGTPRQSAPKRRTSRR